jgi:hypothetical protein
MISICYYSFSGIETTGSATYYLIAQFKDEKDTEFVEKCTKVILNDLAKFEEDWQNIRGVRTHVATKIT